MSARTIIVTGSIAMDRIFGFTGDYSKLILPEHIPSLSLSVLLDEHTLHHGGVGANIAFSLAQLGEAPVLYGAVGNDAGNLLEKLSKLGVNTKHIFVSKKSTATFIVFTDAHGRQVAGFYPGAMSDAAALDFHEFSEDTSTIALIAPHDPVQMLRQVALCREQQRPYIFDPGQQTAHFSGAELKVGWEGAAVLFANEYEVAMICQKCGIDLATLASHVPVLIVTRGEKGSTIYVRGAATEVLAVPPTRVVDPTGAGDAYRAGFLYGYVRDWPPLTCAQLGATVASFCVEQRGGQSHQLSLSHVKKRFEQQFGPWPKE